MRKRRRLVCGVGVNDADYEIIREKRLELVGGKERIKQILCPFYQTWRDMLLRGYSEKYKHENPTYADCTVCEEWLIFSNFKSWMETQDWEGKQLDKDLLFYGNKHYSPETCCFVPPRVNSFIASKASYQGNWPMGVGLDKRCGKYRARICCGNGTTKYLGYFDTPEEAHASWLKAKLGFARELAEDILIGGGDPRVAEALISRYENYNAN